MALYTIQGATVPGVYQGGDTQGVTLGIRFFSSVNATVVGIRYYRGATDMAVNEVGALYTVNANVADSLLSQGNFGSDTAVGWKEITLSSPVAITASTNYVAAVFFPFGKYTSLTAGINSDIVSGILTGRGHAPPVLNCLYKYGSSLEAPDGSGGGNLYGVDVIVEYNAPGGSLQGWGIVV